MKQSEVSKNETGEPKDKQEDNTSEESTRTAKLC